ncbi:flagellar protein FlgN [bacterium]|nr:flagellar protein FlgN [bacterium]
MTSSDPASAELHELLSRELDLMDQLADVMQRKQRLLVASSTAGLAELSHQEEELAQRLARLERQRIDLVARQHGLDPQQAAQLSAAQLGGDALLDDLAGGMRLRIDELQQLQDDNRVLTERLVEYGELVLKLVTQGEGQPGYNSHGRPAEGSRRELLNCRI